MCNVAKVIENTLTEIAADYIDLMYDLHDPIVFLQILIAPAGNKALRVVIPGTTGGEISTLVRTNSIANACADLAKAAQSINAPARRTLAGAAECVFQLAANELRRMLANKAVA